MNKQETDKRGNHVAGVIMAAGCSSRMGQFKPLLPIGDTTFIKRIIGVMRSAGIGEIVVVGGAKYEELSAHLYKEDVRLLYNAGYETTDMFTSFQIALRTLTDVPAIVATPVDIALPDTEVYQKLLGADPDADLVKPTYQGRGGHPLLIRQRVFPALLSYTGEDGLRGALIAANAVCARVDVKQKGILMDADTPEDYKAVCDMLKY